MLDLLKKLFSRRFSLNTKTVGSALLVELGPYSSALMDAVAAIDAVHTDGVLPSLAVKRETLNAHGMFIYNTRMEAVAIKIHYSTSHPELTLAHEIGHLLDLKGIDTPNQFASETSSILDKWRDAVISSEAITKLGNIHKSPDGIFTETLPTGNAVEYLVDRNYADYLLDNKEVWARSYSQYIALKSGNNIMLSQLDVLRDQPHNGIYYAEQWDNADFEPIMLAIDHAFEQLGWTKK